MGFTIGLRIILIFFRTALNDGRGIIEKAVLVGMFTLQLKPVDGASGIDGKSINRSNRKSETLESEKILTC